MSGQPPDDDELRALWAEIRHLPPPVQMERMLGLLTKRARKFDGADLELLMRHFRNTGTPEGETLADLFEGELALRRLARPE